MFCICSLFFCDPMRRPHPFLLAHCHQPPTRDPHSCPIPERWHCICLAYALPGSSAQTAGDTVHHHPVDCAGRAPDSTQEFNVSSIATVICWILSHTYCSSLAGISLVTLPPMYLDLESLNSIGDSQFL